MTDEIERPHESTQSPDIRKARLVFRRKKDGSKAVTITICYFTPCTQERVWGKERFSYFPKEIDEEELRWKIDKGERIAVYRRIGGNYNYRDIEHKTSTTRLSQRLEELVLQVYSNKTTEAKEPELS